ncbi:MAG: ATP-binding protein [Vicinamibacterales bacterium]
MRVSLAVEHLLLRLRPINRALRTAVVRQQVATARLVAPGAAPLCVTDDQVEKLLLDVDEASDIDPAAACEPVLTAEELAAELDVRARAAAAGVALPLDALAAQLELSAFEQDAVVLCAAPEISRSYERIFAFVLDDLNRRLPCVEVMMALAPAPAAERLARRRALSRFGILRRTGVLRPWGDAATDQRQELRLSAPALDFLMGEHPGGERLFSDPADVPLSDAVVLPDTLDRAAIARLGAAMADGSLNALGVWGPRYSGHDDVVHAVVAASNRRLRALPATVFDRPADAEQALRDAVQTASALGAALWIATDSLSEPGGDRLRELVVDALVPATVPVCLSGANAWRPARLLRARRYLDLMLPPPEYPTRKALWSGAFPELTGEAIDDLASRFRIGSSEVAAVARAVRTADGVLGGGDGDAHLLRINRTAGSVVRSRAESFATLITPSRTSDDLVLPSDVQSQVMEVARFYRAASQVSETWRLGRVVRDRGFKALFIGESGTGKTLAAEVIASMVGLPLLKVDLARVVSKWVGETEKNLHTAFKEGEGAALFFDEADALFGKRGEVRHGTDRYANLEVSYLLQRLEEYDGLVILASNLKDQIDDAFTRRFQAVVHFPKPRPAERLRIWELALPDLAPAAREALPVLVHLEMTGASIVGAARTAALVAADEGAQEIAASHLVRGVARQHRREARVLSAADLGPYGAMLQAPA